MQCSNCNKKMIKTDRRNEMAELNDDATDGQMADFLASEEYGEHGAWNLGIVEYECQHCGNITQIQSDELFPINSLILGWHQKAKGEDYFSGFVFEYLALIAHVRNNLYRHIESDRRAVQNLKRDVDCQKKYLEKIRNDRALINTWNEVIKELNTRPLHNSSYDIDDPYIDKWWNCSEDTSNKNEQLPKGCVLSTEDWTNMVEFWHSIRNNLFHGGKDPNLQRDRFLVEHAYKTLSKFMELEIESIRLK